jgi:hypothetical protein
MKLWIARDKDGSLYLYDSIPEKIMDMFFERDNGKSLFIGVSIFPEVTFENSPQEVEIKLKNELSFEEMEELIDDLI